MINVYKSPISKEKYANLFLDKIPESAKNVCLLFIGHSETVHYIMSQKPEIDFTVIDGSDVTEALPYIYTADNLKNTISFEESDCEDETFLKKLETCFENYIMNNMSFDLIIANPPYGKSSSLSKKIVNKMLECKVAEEMVVLAPPKTYEDCITFVSKLGWSGQTPEVFDIPEANAQLITVATLTDKKSNSISIDDLYLSEKQQQLKTAVTKYNATHTPFYKELIQQMTISRKSRYAYLKDELIFVVPIWTPLDGVHACDSSDRRHNLEHKPVAWKDGSSGDYGIYFEDEMKLKNFTDWWYAKPGRNTEAQKSLINNLLKILSARYGKGCSIEKYKEILPALDWSRPHDDAEILKEIGLPEDFLEKE